MMLDKLTTELTTCIVPAMAKTATPSGFDSAGSPSKSQEAKEESKGTEDEKKISVMDDLFRGELTNCITCPCCGNVSEKRETFYYLSLPLPQEEAVITLTCVKRCSGDNMPPPMESITVKVQKTTRLGEFLAEISRTAGIAHENILLAEANGCKISRRISGDPKSLISTHGIRPGVDLYAYEVFSSPEQCQELFPKRLKELCFEVGEMVDVYDPDAKQWKIGRISRLSSGAEIHVMIEGQTPAKELRVDRGEASVAPFMTNTVSYKEIEVLPLYHRYQRQDGNFVYFGRPKLIALGEWATCYQVASEVVLQARHFMGPEVKGNGTLKIRPFMSIAGGNMHGRRPTELPGRAASVSIPKHASMFNITLIDTSTNTCAVCSSRQIAGQWFLQSLKPKKCKGCSILDNHDLPIKYPTCDLSL